MDLFLWIATIIAVAMIILWAILTFVEIVPSPDDDRYWGDIKKKLEKGGE